MATLIRSVRNELSSSLTLHIPGANPTQAVTLAPSVTVDLLTKMSADELEVLQPELSGMVARGSITSQATISDTTLFAVDSAALTAAQKQSTIATADSAVTAEVDATDLATAITLVNDLKAKYNAAVTLINALKAKVNAMNA